MSHKYQDNLPSASSIQKDNRNTWKEREKADDIDKFAILFSPSTPRASPTFDFFSDIPSNKPGTSMPRPSRRSLSSASDDFGSFVSVPVSEAPLAMGLGFDAISPQQAKPPVPQPSSDLLFFDQFGQNAKKASEKNRKSVLEELLLHEDDPLYWLKENSGFVDGDKMKQHGDEFATTKQKDTEEYLIDLDSDFFDFKADSLSSTSSQPRTQSSPPSLPSFTRSSKLTRSPTLTAPTTLAPPLAYTSTEAPLTIPPPSDITDETNPTINPSSVADDNPSHPYQSISSLPSRWMSSFLPSSRPLLPGARPTLESIFAQSDSTPSSLRSTPPSGLQVQATTLHTTSLPQPKFVPVPFEISHETAFAASSITHSSSPFASHVFIAPTGAPGFRGEQYDWDKGFSQELEQELKVKSSGAPQNRGLSGKENGGVMLTQGQDRKASNLGLAKPDSGHDAQKVGGAVAELIEKKIGSVEMKGRRVATSPVLEQKLADMIRSYFPALARLPKSWNLLYSLDQHGISLNTLYSRCEAQTQVRPGAPKPEGALIVVKDAGNALFGVWLGEGIRMCRGKGYYGSGESFLWKYVGGKLEIFKWTGKNDYVALCEPDFLSFGGGDGHYGLYLDESLFEGSSAPCPTFDNPPLCTPGHRKANTVEFECFGLEVWGIGP